MRTMSLFPTPSEWVPPSSFPDLSDAKEIAARIRSFPCDSEDNDAGESNSLDSHMASTDIDPFDEVFGDD